MKVTALFLLNLFGFSLCLHSQNQLFPQSGTIDYEKTINMYSLIRKYVQQSSSTLFYQAFEDFKSHHEQFIMQRCSLSFFEEKTSFTPEKDIGNRHFFSNIPFLEQTNNVLSDLAHHQCIKMEKVFDDIFIVKDSMQKIRWKITDETRDIAGYNCRRANGVMLDSIYVVAFYTDEIQFSGGPESFSGLPGMILGVVLPHEYVSWFAVNVLPNNEAHPFSLPEKATIIDRKGLYSKLLAASSNWGGYANGYLKAFLF